MKILVINSGSSSIKYQLFDMRRKVALTGGLIERIGSGDSLISHWCVVNGAQQKIERAVAVLSHEAGLRLVADLLTHVENGVITHTSEIDAVGHRVVHGGERFSATTLITEEVLETIRRLIPFAPLHNPPNLTGIEVARKIFPGAKQVAVFDTAFHQTMPPEAFRYAIPNPFYTENGVRVYGFHGTSHRYVAKEAARHLGKNLSETNLITAHLGNGASMTAIREGKSVDTSMGFSPLPGLMMGTRCGDIDPAVIFYLIEAHGMHVDDINILLNRKSGLLGIAGIGDLRDVLDRADKGDADARLALKMYTYRIKKYIGAYLAILGHVDALVFTAGVGENSPVIRWRACKGLDDLGISLDEERNAAAHGGIREIQSPRSRIKVLVIPTDEELEIAIQTEKILEQGS